MIESIDIALAELVDSSREWIPSGDIPDFIDLSGIRHTKSQSPTDGLIGKYKQISNYSKKDLIDRLLDMRGESC